MQSAIKKRSVCIGSRRTSISLENEFWDALNNIAWERRTTMAQLLDTIERERKKDGQLLCNLSSAVRIFVLKYFQKNAVEKAAD